MKYHIHRVVLFLFLWLMANGVHAQTIPVVSMEDSPHFVADQSVHQFNIRIDSLSELFAFSVELSYDPTAIQVLSVFSYDFLSTSSTTGSRTVQYVDYSTAGKIVVDEAILGVTPETSANGVLFTVFYRAAQFGVQKKVPIDFTVCLLRDEYNNPITRTVHDGMIYLWYGRVKVKAFLQGPYVASTGSMHTQLRDADYAAQRQNPYTSIPISWPGQLPAGVVDWVMVKLRTSATAPQAADSVACFLRSDGLIVAATQSANSDIPFAVPAGNYFAVVVHRNHLSVMSATNFTVGTASPTSPFDFSASASQAYGTNPMANLATNVYGLRSGDGDSSGRVNAIDLINQWIPQNGLVGFYSADYDLTSRVNALDLIQHWYPNNGSATQVP